ncbi:hypothetical protein IP90_00507 [Luteimonas cucumeris]|uniref:S1/P1 nuclease n=1 Tax=Luteimonas cucumeris TaxID=985012 RepID=A0A562LF48_9GAMM|nr:S1/P1 nuclease [Luteimonas cucumeris]TWI06242.1 hypothetical protein IP90_00507 [Luteimonas cucumeris]
MNRNRTALRLSVIAFLLLSAPMALGWSALGHRLIGELAQRHLTPAARAEVADLLAGEPDPTLSGVATWADTLRDHDPELGRKTSRWHYVNFEPGRCEYQPKRDCPDGNCVIAQIEAQRAILADRGKTPAQRREALKFLVHLVGDVHQPLHASNRKDKGGNDFQVSLRTPLAPESYARDRYVDGVMGTNLHSVWDYYILGSADLGTGMPAARGKQMQAYADRLGALPWPPRDTAATTDAVAWAEESCRLLDSRQIYPRQHRMDSVYLDAHRALAEQRVRQAAYRLAGLLNATLN